MVDSDNETASTSMIPDINELLPGRDHMARHLAFTCLRLQAAFMQFLYSTSGPGQSIVLIQSTVGRGKFNGFEGLPPRQVAMI
jgi:hypothetical protein